MSQKRDLGPILALAGGALALIAVIAGFILVGGPGDARDRRLDEMTVDRIADVMHIAQCAFNESGIAPARFSDALNARGWIDEGRQPVACDLGAEPGQFANVETETPENPGDVTYKAMDADSIRVCANFRRPYEGEDCRGVCYGSTEYTEWHEPRPSGVVCKDSTLQKMELTPPFRLSH